MSRDESRLDDHQVGGSCSSLRILPLKARMSHDGHVTLLGQQAFGSHTQQVRLVAIFVMKIMSKQRDHIVTSRVTYMHMCTQKVTYHAHKE